MTWSLRLFPFLLLAGLGTHCNDSREGGDLTSWKFIERQQLDGFSVSTADVWSTPAGLVGAFTIQKSAGEPDRLPASAIPMTAPSF